MTNKQAVNLRPGHTVRRKRPSDDTATYVVERVERVKHPTMVAKNGVIVHAGGRAFRPWEIERVDPLPGWSALRDAT